MKSYSNFLPAKKELSKFGDVMFPAVYGQTAQQTPQGKAPHIYQI